MALSSLSQKLKPDIIVYSFRSVNSELIINTSQIKREIIAFLLLFPVYFMSKIFISINCTVFFHFILIFSIHLFA